MIYLYKAEENFVVTDSLGETLSGPLVIYIDDILIGTFENESTDNNYLAFTFLPEHLINLQNSEGQFKIYNYDKLIKQELLSILDIDSIKPLKIKSKNNTIKYYNK